MAFGKQKSVEASRFAMMPRSDVPRSAFDVEHGHKTTGDAGFLLPLYVDEVLPGDTMRVKMTLFARLSTPIVPVMDNLIMESFFFFVPNRLVWSNWERFMGEQLNPTDTTEFLVPVVPVPAAYLVPGTLADYFGITTNGGSVNDITVNALPFRGYNLIWNDFFRDQDLQVPVTVPVGDGPDVWSTTYGTLRRGKRSDYFTSARPWLQKGTPGLGGPGVLFGELNLPGSGRFHRPQAGAPVSGIGVVESAGGGAGGTMHETGSRTVAYPFAFSSNVDVFQMRRQSGEAFPDVRVLINDLRTANAVQVLLEMNARGGTRYTEIVRSHFGVTSPDARLQRPEYLGGGRTQVTVNPVAQTSASGATGTTTVLGELAGVGTALASNGFSQSFTEHGFIIGLVSVRADLSYQQGVNRMWYRLTRYDYYWPAFANLGEQPIHNREIYVDGGTNDTLVFGYQERWSEYKYKPSRISGAFRSTNATPLDMWHFSQKFTALPLLNEAFIVEDPPVDRVLQVEAPYNQQFLIDALFDCRLVRAMPMRSIPGLSVRL